MNIHKKTVLILFPLILVMLVTYLFVRSNQIKQLADQQKAMKSTELPKQIVYEVMDLINSKDFRALSEFIDGSVGVDLKPYYASSSEQGRHLTKDEINSFFFDVAKRKWGTADGSGMDIVLSNEDYYTSFIYSLDFSKLGVLSEGKTLVKASTPSLDKIVAELYGSDSVTFVEYYISDIDPKYEGMDWQSLALVFKNIKNSWKLVGILHNQWTI